MQTAAVAAASLLLAVPAASQSPGAACDALPDDGAKLRCFNAVVRDLEAGIAGRREPAADEPPSPPAAARSEAARPVTAEPAPSAPSTTALEAPAASAPTTRAPAPPAASPTTVAAPSATANDSVGRRDGIEIVSITKGPLGNLTVRLENGEVWRQLDSDNTRVVLPDDATTRYAVIEEGFLGSRRMKIAGTARSFRVRRVE